MLLAFRKTERDASSRKMNIIFRHPDLNAHEPGCMLADGSLPPADPYGAYVDVFCECHRYTVPKILMNGTDIAWPAGWTPELAADWRKQKGIVPLV